MPDLRGCGERTVTYHPTLTSAFADYLYVVPTAAWEQSSSSPDRIVRRRRGGGLRIYLDRPWYSSGNGELLGVVVLDPARPPHPAWYPSVTVLGCDPTRRGSPLRPLDAETFRNPTTVVRDVPIPQLGPDAATAIVGYEPHDDAETARWFCDLVLDTGPAYTPFVRLALVRYQPNSIAGAHLSPIVLADPVQLLPDRELVVEPAGQAYRVQVAGPTYVADEPELHGRMYVRWEQRAEGMAGDDFGWSPQPPKELPLSLPVQPPLIGTWSGEAPLPASVPASQLRLTVFEEEPRISDDPAVLTTGRVVYSDTVTV